MRHTTTAIAAALLLAGTAVGCSSDSDKPTVTKATGSSTTSSTPSPSPSPTPETYTDAAPIVVTPFVWQLAYADGARFEATSMSGGDFPQPLYPVDAKVRGGDCVRGHVLFEVPKAGEAERVLYSPDALDEPVEWQLAK